MNLQLHYFLSVTHYTIFHGVQDSILKIELQDVGNLSASMITVAFEVSERRRRFQHADLLLIVEVRGKLEEFLELLL